MAANHDKLQKECFEYLWNYHPATRRTFWHTPNTQRPYPGESKRGYIIRLKQAEAIGVLAGVTDLVFYWSGCLYMFDIKIGADTLSEAQKKFIAANVAQGGKFTEIENIEQFKTFCLNLFTENIQ